ncbi:MAG: sulfite exporter TauE/SafE family protein [Burkholderiaceae bacterium]|nr:sulfite exporter TauE/SafE family protein [Burkholderiaceae bacterium]
MLSMMVALLVIGAFTGFMAGLLGVGGGMMLTPFMTFLFTVAKFPPELVIKMALATSLTTILFTSIGSVRAHHKGGKVRWDIARPMGIGAFIGTFIGANFAGALKSQWLAIFFALFVGYSAIKMFRTSKPKPSREVPGSAPLAAVGSGIGFVSSLVGAGGGFLTTPFLVWCNVTMHQAIGTSAALGFPIAAGGLMGYIIAGLRLENLPEWSIGYIYLPALAACAAASLITAPIGARTAHKMNVASLKRAFAVLLLALALYMGSRAF